MARPVRVILDVNVRIGSLIAKAHRVKQSVVGSDTRLQRTLYGLWMTSARSSPFQYGSM